MGRLIDADALIETLTKYKFGAISNDTEREYVKETVLNFVNEQPTAYDVEKVADGIRETCYQMGLDESQAEILIEGIRAGGKD